MSQNNIKRAPLSWETWLLLVFLGAALILTSLYGFMTIRENGEYAAEFLEKAGGELLLSHADDPYGWYCLLNADTLPPVQLKNIDTDLQVRTFLSSQPAVTAFYPIALTRCYLFVDKEHKLAVRLYGIDITDFTQFYATREIIRGKLPESAGKAMVFSGDLILYLVEQFNSNFRLDDSMLIIADTDTFLSSAKLPVKAAMLAPGKAIVLDRPTYNQLVQAQSDTVLIPPNTANTGEILNKEFPVKTGKMADNEFFDIIDAAGVPQAPPIVNGSPFLIVRTTKPAVVSALLKSFFKTKSLPVRITRWQDWKQYNPKAGEWLMPALIIGFSLLSGLGLFLVLRRKQKDASGR